MTDATNAVAQAAHHAAEAAASSHGITHMMMLLIIQLAVIIIVAKIGGYLVQRFLKMPSVLGELLSGMLIGPYALGTKIILPDFGPLFAEHAGFAASTELYGIATLASIILLFLAGLETDIAAFLRYSVVGSSSVSSPSPPPSASLRASWRRNGKWLRPRASPFWRARSLMMFSALSRWPSFWGWPKSAWAAAKSTGAKSA